MGYAFFEGVAKASSMILVSEVGDKTFFLAALMAMRHPRRYVVVGSLSALWIMTLLSTFLGWSAPNLLPRTWTHALATLLFFGFGLRSLWEGIAFSWGSHGSRAEEEMREAEAQLARQQLDKDNGGDNEEELKSAGLRQEQQPEQLGREDSKVTHRTRSQEANGSVPSAEQTTTKGSEGRKGQGQGQGRLRRFIVNPVVVQAFSLIFFGEWGDKSQIATIGLAAQENVWGVALGGCLGHLVCNGAAVLGGKHLASKVSEQMVALLGGFLFIGFGFHSLLVGPP